MESSTCSCARVLVCLLIVTMFASATLLAEDEGYTGGSFGPCDGTTKDLTWSGSFEEDGYDVVGCYAPVYGPWSPLTYYSPGSGPGAAPPTTKPESSDGSESVEVPLHAYGHTLQGVFVWFEFGVWRKDDEGNYYWIGLGWLCDWHWIPNTPTTCFSPGTHIITKDGSKPIEKIVPGDRVLSSRRDDLTTAANENLVTEVIESRAKVLHIGVCGEIIKMTREHPVYVQSKGWVSASSLSVGDLLRSHSERWAKVTSISQGEESKVFNIIIDRNSAFYVGHKDWGFSMCSADGCGPSSPPARPLLKSHEDELVLGYLK